MIVALLFGVLNQLYHQLVKNLKPMSPWLYLLLWHLKLIHKPFLHDKKVENTKCSLFVSKFYHTLKILEHYNILVLNN